MRLRTVVLPRSRTQVTDIMSSPQGEKKKEEYELVDKSGGQVETQDASANIYTIDEAIEYIGCGFFQLFILCFAGLIWVCYFVSATSPDGLGVCKPQTTQLYSFFLRCRP